MEIRYCTINQSDTEAFVGQFLLTQGTMKFNEAAEMACEILYRKDLTLPYATAVLNAVRTRAIAEPDIPSGLGLMADALNLWMKRGWTGR